MGTKRRKQHQRGHIESSNDDIARSRRERKRLLEKLPAISLMPSRPMNRWHEEDYSGLDLDAMTKRLADIYCDLARDGSVDSAEQILYQFIESVTLTDKDNWCGSVPWVYMCYIAAAFSKILSGEHADTALGLKSKKAGRRPGTRTHDKQALGAACCYLIDHGYASEDAIEDLRRQTGADRRTIQRARAVLMEKLDHPGIDAKLLVKHYMSPYAAEIDAILTAAKSRDARESAPMSGNSPGHSKETAHERCTTPHRKGARGNRT